MSSHHLPGKDENPFGYTFTTEDIDHAAAEENVTAAGPPLLSDFQNTQLQNFFDQGPFNAFTNNFNFTEADLHGPNDPPQPFNFDFYAGPPPTFHGTVNDATHANSIYGGLERPMDAEYVVPSHNDARGGASDEVIGAANALLSGTQPQGDPTYAEKDWGNFMGLPSPPASAAFTSGSDQRNLTAPAAADNDTKPPARENLTEEQKRSNHILSEQKRRNLIKQGFDEMNELVPGLKAGGFSKSSTLMEGAKFLEDLIVGNQILRQALGEV
ncbi:putative hlh transcription [Diplodia seriata]|uniref:Putative hlh transcription n=1 Tax=Diplodia seriata TaxID=420778 RepID=A0A0G2EJU8_9PEZI|nr:putative hlh transcription [Diplodia seriata]